MRPAMLCAALAALVVAAPHPASAQAHACLIAPVRACHGMHAAGRHRHVARALLHRRLARYGRPYHIPRFSQAEAEAEVHTAYPYRTGIYAPWPEFYGTPYDPPY